MLTFESTKAFRKDVQKLSAIVLLDNQENVVAAGSFLPGCVVPDGECEIDCVLDLISMQKD
jgi:hypothetical protein